MMQHTTKSNRQLLYFFLYAFAIAWALMAIAVARNYGLISLRFPVEPFVIIGSWVPNIAAFIMLGVIMKRKGGIRELFSGWLKVRIHFLWFLLALSPLLISLLTIIVYGLVKGSWPVSDVLTDPTLVITMIVMSTVTGAMGEELGWRGFALPRMQTFLNALTASIILGILWALWHLPLWYAGIGYENIPYWAFALIAISFSTVVTWACNNTKGSLFIASLSHLCLNLSINVIETRAIGLHAFLFLVFAAAITIIYGPGKLSKLKELPINKHTGEWL